MGESERRILQASIEEVKSDLRRTGEEVSSIRKSLPRIIAHVENEQDWKRLIEGKIETLGGVVEGLRAWKEEMLVLVGKITGAVAVGGLIAGYVLSKIFH